MHTRYRQPGGEDRVVEAEASLLQRLGHDVTELRGDNPTGAIATAAALLRAPWNRAAARHVAESVDRLRPDVVHVHNTWFSLSPAVVTALRQVGVPVVVTLHNFRLLCARADFFRDGRPCTSCVGSGPLPAIRHACYHDSRLASVPPAATIALNSALGTWRRHVDLFLTPTAFVRDQLVAAGFVASEIMVKPHFVPDQGTRPAPPSQSSTIVFVGRLSVEKGLEPLLGAFELARARAPHLELLVIGDGPERARLEAIAGSNVTFAGWLPAHVVSQHLLAARLLAFPSLWYETFGLVLAEALSAGLPVVASGHGVAPDVLGDAAVALPRPDDADGWAEALLAPDALVDARSTTGRRRWQERFSPSPGGVALLEAYERAVQHHNDLHG